MTREKETRANPPSNETSWWLWLRRMAALARLGWLGGKAFELLDAWFELAEE